MKCKHISNKIQMNLKYHLWNLICSTLLPLLLSVSKSFLISVSESNFLVSLIKSEMFLTLDTYSHQQLSIGLRCAININYLVIFSVCNGQKEAFYTMVKSFSVHQEIYFIIMCLHLFGYFLSHYGKVCYGGNARQIEREIHLSCKYIKKCISGQW